MPGRPNDCVVEYAPVFPVGKASQHIARAGSNVLVHVAENDIHFRKTHLQPLLLLPQSRQRPTGGCRALLTSPPIVSMVALVSLYHHGGMVNLADTFKTS